MSILGGMFVGIECVDGWWRIETGQDKLETGYNHDRLQLVI